MPGFLDCDHWLSAHAVFVRLRFIDANEHGECYRATSSLIEKCRALSRKKPARLNEMLAEKLDSFATLLSQPSAKFRIFRQARAPKKKRK
jgi:hypothetical protein